MNKQQAIQIARETMEILEKGEYKNRYRQTVSIKQELDYAIKHSVLYTPEETDKLLQTLSESKPSGEKQTVIEVTRETTLEASKRLVEEGYENVACLNFASAKHPGGGFLTGSRAQEESLARSSGLYPAIAQMKEMYEYNKQIRTALYSDYMIFSPKVPVFRDDKGVLLDTPYVVSMITSPAVNAGVVRERERHNISAIDKVMSKRIEKILAVATHQQQEALVLGAFGCGVFQNNPYAIANHFKKALEDERFKGKFQKVVFAIYENSPQKEIYRIFQQAFQKYMQRINQ
jgi:uncharacterized protein (TIGR02452 family)